MADEAPGREYDRIEGIAAPEQTASLVGHEAAYASILEAAEAGRLHHAWLLHGPRGIGKATFAFAVARDLLARSSGEPAERVREQVAHGAHPNLRIVRRRRNERSGKFYADILVEDVRGLIGYFQHTSARAGARIAILDAVEDMNRNAVNALLKTLEEPPAHGLLLLISHRPGLVIPTIRSRCRAMALRQIADDEVGAVIDASGLEPGAGARAQAIALAGGRPRKALETLVLGETGVLQALSAWLAQPDGRRGARHLAIAADLSRGAGEAAYPIALDMINGWIAARAHSLAGGPDTQGAPLAMVTDLWDKAHALASDQAVYNLDRRQTLVMMLDAIRDLDDRI